MDMWCLNLFIFPQDEITETRTFSVFDSTYYKPGGPVFLYIGGETRIENRFSNLQTGSKYSDLRRSQVD